MSDHVTVSQESTILTPHATSEETEEVALETPFTVTLNDHKIGSSMVLPIGLEEFGVGFLFGQGYIHTPEEVKEVIVCPEGKIAVYADVDELEKREVIITSGCGGTGKISKEMLEGTFEPPLEATITFPEIKSFIRGALNASDLGNRTHCVHGCGLWNTGKLVAFFEDVGRHNTIDKIIGAILLGRASARGAIYTTGRLTSDMVLKCAMIGIPIIMSRTSPSSLGVAIAKRAEATLIAYARPERLNVFHRPDRVVLDPELS